jgi:hypothetical protein
VADRLNIRQAADAVDRRLIGRDPLQHNVERGSYVTDRPARTYRRLRMYVKIDRRGTAYPFYVAFGKYPVSMLLDLLKAGRNKLELQRRAPAVEYEDIHSLYPTPNHYVYRP